MSREKVVVIGAGNSAMCAALSAREQGAEVVVLEASSRAMRGGNSRYAAGAMRVAFESIDELSTLLPELSEDEKHNTDFGTYTSNQYTTEQFYDDLVLASTFRADPDLIAHVVDNSLSTLRWMTTHGVSFLPLLSASFVKEGIRRFKGGTVLIANGGGVGLVEALHTAAERVGVQVRYETRARELVMRHGKVAGVEVDTPAGREVIEASTVVLACGGFQANPSWRAKYLGQGWDIAKVRGTNHNVGDGHRMAVAAGARTYGEWSGAHAVAWDRNAPEMGDPTVGDGFQKHSYDWGILVNELGERFVDEGARVRELYYATLGRAILAQPQSSAWQIFDVKSIPHLRDEYRIPQVTRVRADSIAELAHKMDVDSDRLKKTIDDYNGAIQRPELFDLSRLDGCATSGIFPPRSNWARAIEEPPFEAYHVTCGITFTYGGVKVDQEARVLDTAERPIPGLFATGEILGGLYYGNCPGGTGLTVGATFGRTAGAHAGALSLTHN